VTGVAVSGMKRESRVFLWLAYATVTLSAEFYPAGSSALRIG
jgi:hypothetical protein